MDNPTALQPLSSNTTEFIVIGVYFCFLIAVGIVFGRLVRNSSDYFRAGGQASWWLVGLSMFMSGISTYTFVGNAAGIFKSGWSPLAIYAANVSGFLLSGLILAAWHRQMRVVTVAEAIRARFGHKSEVVLATLMVVNGLVWTGAVLYGLSVFFTLLLPGVP
jgi:Na+/proline symporter